MNDLLNLTRLKVVRKALEPLNRKIVFVGGAILSCYPDRPIMDIRPTDDVDVIIEMISYSDRVEIEEQLIKEGFSHDIASGVICRYKTQGIAVDIMSTTDVAMGFSNRWYPDGYRDAMEYRLNDGSAILILKPVHYLATKLEAFNKRGRKDVLRSHDFEDIVYLLEGRSTIWTEMLATTGDLRTYLNQEFERLQAEQDILEWLEGHVDRTFPNSAAGILESIRQFVKQ